MWQNLNNRFLLPNYMELYNVGGFKCIILVKTV